jgi:hypothetical protein
MKCAKCGYVNSQDALFCEKCGSALKNIGNQDEGMSNGTKILILAVVILVGALGLVSGVLLTKTNVPVSNQTNVTVTETNTGEVAAGASWHQITSFSGTDNDYRTFQTKGNKFKVDFSAFPLKNYDTNQMSVQIGNSNGVLGSGSVEWSSMEDLVTKSRTIEITGSPGAYWIRINTKDLENWNIIVYDYY